MVDDLHIIKCNGYFTVVNKTYHAEREQHSHFNKMKGALMLKRLVERKEVPRSPYYKESALRVSINEDYKNKILLS